VVAALAVALLRGVDVAEAVQDAVMDTSRITTTDREAARKRDKSTLIWI
jgi:hypothetical protein